MALSEVGLQAVIANLSQFESGAKAIQRAYDDINHKAGAVEKATGGLGTALTGLGSNLLNIGAIAGGAALAGVTALGAGLATFAVTGINKAIDLDAQMATIAATMNTTKDAVGPLKDLILDLALDPKLTVNTTQAADAIQLLAQNGATADQIMGGLAKSTVALANATGAQFSTAADVASGILKVFNLDVKDMGQAIDGITGVVNQSKFTIDDYAQAFAQAGSVAAGMGVSLQDFNTVITATSNSFTSGSDAGTSFKTLLQRLANPTDEVRAVTEKYGISLFDAAGNMRPLAEVAGQLNTVLQGTATITSTVGGATKKMTAAAEAAQKAIPNLTTSIGQQEAKLKILQDELGAIAFHYGADSLRARKAQLAIDNLTISIDQNKTKLSDYQGAIAAVSGAQEQQVTSTKKLTEAEKAELAAVIGGADAARIVLALSQVTADEFDNLSGSVNDVGQAFRAAATRVDSVKGAFEIFRGIVEAVQIQVGDKFLPLLRNITVGFTDLATKSAPMVVAFFGNISNLISRLIGSVTNLFDVFGENGLAGVFASLGFGGSALFLKKLGELAVMMGLTGTNAASLGEIITTTLGAAFTWLTTNLFPMLTQGIEFIMVHFEEFKGALIGIGAVLGAGIFAALVAGIVGLVSPIMLVIGAAALLGAAWAGNWGGIQEKTFAVWAVVQPILTQLMTWLQVNIPIALQFLSTAWSTILLPAITAFVGFLTSTVFPMFASFISTYIDVTTTRAQVLADTWTTYLLPAIQAVWGFINTSLVPLFQSINNLIGAVLTKTLQAWAGLWQNVLLPAIRAVWQFISANVIPIFIDIGSTISESVTPSANDLANNILPALTEGLETVVKWIKDATSYFKGLASAINNMTLPSWLQPGSPPPLAYALQDIAAGANMAGKAMSGFSLATIDSLLNIKRDVVSVNGAIGQARDTVEKFLETTIDDNKTKRALKIMGQIFRDNSEIILGATDRVAKFQELLGNVNFGVNNQQQNAIMGSVGIWLSEFDKNLAAMKAAQKQIFIEAGRTALTIGSKLNDIVSSSADILDQRVKTLQELMDSGLAEVNFDGQIMSAVQAQELLNIALAEQREIQDDILQLKQNEQKLSFLEKQLSLVETLNEAGLDVNDILGGISLGLDASIPDMIAATNKLVMAMIEQVNQDLQMGSPSKVMMDKGETAGESTGLGFVRGLMATIPDISSAIKQAILGPSLVSGPALSSGGSQRVTNNNFNMSVNSGASPQAVMAQFEIARAMA